MDLYNDDEDIEDVVLDDERERHWCMFFEDNKGGVDGTKALLHDKKWDVYNSDKEALVKGEYSVEVYNNDGKKLVWEFVNDHVVEEGVEHEELGLQGFGFNLFNEDRGVCVGEDVKELPYLLMLMKLWTGYWEEQLKRMNKVEGRLKRMEYFGNFSIYQGIIFGRTLGVLCQHLPLALGV